MNHLSPLDTQVGGDHNLKETKMTRLLLIAAALLAVMLAVSAPPNSAGYEPATWYDLPSK